MIDSNIPKFGMIAGVGEHVVGHAINYAQEDSFRVVEGCVLEACISRDLAGRNDQVLAARGHRDHVQPIPQDGEYINGRFVHYWNQQYAAAEIQNLMINNCLFHSPDTMMQGIFQGDGFIRYPVITDNEINTASEHKISICALDGVVAGNVDASGRPVQVVLTGLKIAGGLPGRQLIKIMGFKHDQYADAKSIIKEDPEYWTDERTQFDRNTIHLDDFDLQAFRKAARAVESHCENVPRGANAMCVDFWDLAQQYGKQVRRYV